MDNSNDGTKDTHVPTSEVDMPVSSADVPTSSGSMPAPPAEAPAPSVHPTTVLVPDASPPAIHSAYTLDRIEVVVVVAVFRCGGEQWYNELSSRRGEDKQTWEQDRDVTGVIRIVVFFPDELGPTCVASVPC